MKKIIFLILIIIAIFSPKAANAYEATCGWKCVNAGGCTYSCQAMGNRVLEYCVDWEAYNYCPSGYRQWYCLWSTFENNNKSKEWCGIPDNPPPPVSAQCTITPSGSDPVTASLAKYFSISSSKSTIASFSKPSAACDGTKQVQGTGTNACGTGIGNQNGDWSCDGYIYSAPHSAGTCTLTTNLSPSGSCSMSFTVTCNKTATNTKIGIPDASKINSMNSMSTGDECSPSTLGTIDYQDHDIDPLIVPTNYPGICVKGVNSNVQTVAVRAFEGNNSVTRTNGKQSNTGYYYKFKYPADLTGYADSIIDNSNDKFCTTDALDPTPSLFIKKDCTPTAPNPTCLDPEQTFDANSTSLNIVWNAPTNWGDSCQTNTNKYDFTITQDNGASCLVDLDLSKTNNLSNPSINLGPDCSTGLTAGTYSYVVTAKNGGTSKSINCSFTVGSAPPPSSGGYFLTYGGNVSAKGSIANSIPAGNYIAGNVANSPAGIVTSGSSISATSGTVSESGWSRSNYADNTPTGQASYTQFLSNVLKNAGITDKSTFEAGCSESGTTYNNYVFYCYSSCGINATLTNAIANTSGKIAVVYPKSSSDEQISNSISLANNSRIIVFVNGNLGNGYSGIKGNIIANHSTSGIVFIVNGNILVNTGVTTMDGVYIFSGNLSSGLAPSTLFGSGMLLGTGKNPFDVSNSTTLLRNQNSTTSPGESWTYEPKYLDLFQNVLTRPKILWSEVAPE